MHKYQSPASREPFSTERKSGSQGIKDTDFITIIQVTKSLDLDGFCPRVGTTESCYSSFPQNRFQTTVAVFLKTTSGNTTTTTTVWNP